MATVKAWKVGETGAPTFPDDFEIVTKAVLQVTDIKTNHNKYYAIEMHRADKGGKTLFRIFTHYGRTDDLETNPEAGQKECRYFATMAEADANYQSIYREKTASRKGYKEVVLASTKIGSPKARGTSSGEVDERTLEKIKGKDGQPAPVVPKTSLHTGIQDLVRYLYDEAKTALTTTVAATITANGIETPLGILSIGQIEKGEKILEDLYEEVQKKRKNTQKLAALTSDFYTAIPHRIGRSRAAVDGAVIGGLEALQQKQDTLQLMKDMLQVNGDGNVLFNSRVDQEYEALNCTVEVIERNDPQYAEIEQHVVKSQIKTRSIKVNNLFRLKRANEWNGFTSQIDNQRLLFHGSRIQNWVGILSRGILLPKIVVSMGVHRTDAGWLGHGIYFGDASCTSACYASPGKKTTSFMGIVRVALGKMKEYHKITYGLKAPPAGYDSCHGVRSSKKKSSDFYDDEYVIYDGKQQRLEYLVEFTH